MAEATERYEVHVRELVTAQTRGRPSLSATSIRRDPSAFERVAERGSEMQDLSSSRPQQTNLPRAEVSVSQLMTAIAPVALSSAFCSRGLFSNGSHDVNTHLR